MDKQKLDYFRNLLLEQRRQATEAMRSDRARALESDDGVIDIGEILMSGDSRRCRARSMMLNARQLLKHLRERTRREHFNCIKFRRVFKSI